MCLFLRFRASKHCSLKAKSRKGAFTMKNQTNTTPAPAPKAVHFFPYGFRPRWTGGCSARRWPARRTCRLLWPTLPVAFGQHPICCLPRFPQKPKSVGLGTGAQLPSAAGRSAPASSAALLYTASCAVVRAGAGAGVRRLLSQRRTGLHITGPANMM